MKMENLIKIYQEQLENLEGLLETGISKQKSIVDNSRELIEKYTSQEESFMSKINRKEIERQNMLQSLLAENSENIDKMPSDGNELMEVLKKIADEDEMKALYESREAITSAIKEIKGVNQQNRFLLEQANSVVKQTLAVMLKFQKKPIVDRRI